MDCIRWTIRYTMPSGALAQVTVPGPVNAAERAMLKKFLRQA